MRSASSGSGTELGKALRVAREAAGVSLSRMAELTHYSKATLGHIETGRRSVSADYVAAYEEALGVRINLHSRIDFADVELLRRAADLITSVGLRHGGVQSAGMAAAQWKWAEGLLNQTMSDNVRVALSAQAARVADRLAWSIGDVGRTARAGKLYKTALELAEADLITRGVVAIDLAAYYANIGEPQKSLELLDSLKKLPAVLLFSANSSKAYAYALMGDWNQTIRHIGLADEAHADVDPETVPDTHRPYLSGHAAHPHRDAGKALHALALAGHSKAVPMAVDRLEHAMTLFGPDRARAVGRCQQRLAALAG